MKYEPPAVYFTGGSLFKTYVLVTTLNTILLREVITAWKLLSFAVIWVPRVVEALIENTVYVYFMTLMLSVFEKTKIGMIINADSGNRI